jgi:uncharacterized phage protein (TIGR02218 family)
LKNASAATIAILASGSFFKADLWSFALAGGATYYFTTSQVPLTAAIYPSGTQHTYLTGLTLMKGGFTQKNTLEVQSLQLDVYPQGDNPGGPVLIGGIPFLKAVKNRLFDAAVVTWSKIFLHSWADTSPGAVLWQIFGINQAVAGRMSAVFTLNEKKELLNVQMPRNIHQASCLHTVFDAGCTLSAATFTVTGAVSGSGGTVTGWSTNLTQADDYWSRGVLTWTSGANAGLSRTLKTYLHTSGAMVPIQPLPHAPANGDAFSIKPACKKTQAACSNTNAALGPAYNNLIHFRGAPYIPNPETLYDGGTSTPQAPPALGSQGGAGVGSPFSGKIPIVKA